MISSIDSSVPWGDGGVFDPGTPHPGLLYTIRFKGIHCKDETHHTDIGSDEIYVVTSVVFIGSDGENHARTEHHPFGQDYYGGVDTNETRIGPVAACWSGNSEPVSLTGTTLTMVPSNSRPGRASRVTRRVLCGLMPE